MRWSRKRQREHIELIEDMVRDVRSDLPLAIKPVDELSRKLDSLLEQIPSREDWLAIYSGDDEKTTIPWNWIDKVMEGYQVMVDLPMKDYASNRISLQIMREDQRLRLKFTFNGQLVMDRSLGSGPADPRLR